jgi:hypothetical protein
MWFQGWIGLILASAAVSGMAAPGLITDRQPSFEVSLPRAYAGEFRWNGDLLPQKVRIKLNTIRRRDAHTVEAVGCGRYDVLGRVTDIGVRMIIEFTSLDVEIWEFDPVGTTTFTTDGSHKGKLRDDLQVIEAAWLSRDTQRVGTLRLRADGSYLSCAVEVALGHRPAGG